MTAIRISAIAPVLNENPWIGFSIMAAMPFVSEFIYALDQESNDGTRELLQYVKEKYLHERLVILDTPNFHPHDMAAYNGAFNSCIKEMTGDAAFFLHPDMLIVQGKVLPKGPQAWFTHMTSFAGDMRTVISKGRANKWKNIHAKTFGLHYYGGYGSMNEDFYHSEITGVSHRHYGTDFSRYPFEVADSGMKIEHYCESKSYARRLEKMKLCLKTLAPRASDAAIEESALQHPRVSLENTCLRFGEFAFEERQTPLPAVFDKFRDEFSQFEKRAEVQLTT